MLSAEKLLSATDVHRVLGLSREGLRKMRARGEAPKSVRVGSVNVTPLGSFLDWVSRELARACRNEVDEEAREMMTIYIWEIGARWLCLAPRRFGTSGKTREEAIAAARKWTSAELQVVNSAPLRITINRNDQLRRKRNEQ